jgi:leucyl aminopeptidase
LWKTASPGRISTLLAWSDKAKPTYDKGATGYGVRLLDQYIADTVEG